MAAAATTVPTLTADQWAQRLLRLYPQNWSGDSAKVAGGVLYSLFNAESTQYNFLQQGLNWVLDACRVLTAQDTALDAIANDFFGDISGVVPAMPRQPGEPDDTYRQRILANIMQSGGTRADISRVVELLTGQTPRITEPWNILDTAACDSISFCDIDTPANPCRVGDQNLPMRYQGFVDSILPSFGDQGNNPVYCVDDGLACDRSFIIDPQPTWFLGEQELDTAINRVRMLNTIVWRRYGGSVSANYARGNSAYPDSGADSVSISLFPPCAQPLVILACAPWVTSIAAKAIDNGDFDLTFEVPAPDGQAADWIAAPITFPGFGILPVNMGATNASLAMPITGEIVFVTPSWNTNVWVTALESGTITFEFDSPAPPGASLNYGSFAAPNMGVVEISAGTITPVQVDFYEIINNPYQLILLPGWNTQFEISKTNIGFTVTFSTPPPSNTFFYWGILNQPY